MRSSPATPSSNAAAVCVQAVGTKSARTDLSHAASSARSSKIADTAA